MLKVCICICRVGGGGGASSISISAVYNVKNSPVLALFSSFLLMSRKRGLSGQRGSRMHWATAGMKVKPNRSGHKLSLPIIASIPNTYNQHTQSRHESSAEPQPCTGISDQTSDREASRESAGAALHQPARWGCRPRCPAGAACPGLLAEPWGRPHPRTWARSPWRGRSRGRSRTDLWSASPRSSPSGRSPWKQPRWRPGCSPRAWSSSWRRHGAEQVQVTFLDTSSHTGQLISYFIKSKYRNCTLYIHIYV